MEDILDFLTKSVVILAFELFYIFSVAEVLLDTLLFAILVVFTYSVVGFVYGAF
jgi:hypothetical protein